MQEPKQGQYLNLHQIKIKVIAREIFYNFGQEFFIGVQNVYCWIYIIIVATIQKSAIIKKIKQKIENTSLLAT